jgi:hypothetical protein
MTSSESNSPASQNEALKTMVWGFALVACAVWFWLHLTGNPIHDLRLMIWARTAPGHVVDTWEDVEDGDDGRVQWTHGSTYTFRLPDGHEVEAATGTRSGRLRPEFAKLEKPLPVEVEYDPADPLISRLKGDGSQSLVEWILRKVGLGGLLLVLFMSPGVKLIFDGVREFRAGSRMEGDN